MNENNYAYLVNQLEGKGFGGDISLQLLNHIYGGQPKFSTQYDVYYGKDKVSALLQFHKSDETGMYVFDNFKVQVLKENNLEPLKQTFYNTSTAENFTLKEAYELMEGRAICKELNTKEGEKHHAWVQLDFKQTDEQGNFKQIWNRDYHLEATLSKHPILELNDPVSRAALMKSLEQGGCPSVTYKVGEGERKVFIETAPRFKSIKIYDVNLQRLTVDQLGAKPTQTTANENNQVLGKQQKESHGIEDSINARNVKHSKRAGIF